MTNRNRHGFSVTKVTELPELGAELIQMTHDKTGLELVWLKRDEENKTFGIAFETLPWNDTGVFHILEHSVLCGSEKYPVKEPFVELLKSSMNTFLNALTFPDKTFYPVSSRNDKDFVNLMRVYLDAVFCPAIYTKPEIFYQEGWHYELDENGKASYKGVVFNEMKGAFADADRLVENSISRILFPDSPYAYVSGGDPACVPDLTYEEFVDSHRRFYAPSNAYVFLDGDMDIDKILGIMNDEYLCKYEKTERMAPPVMQQSVSGEMESCYELAPGETMEGKTRLSYGKVIGTFADREKLVAAQVLADVLCGSNQSPLCSAVLGAGLAEEVTMTVVDGVLQPWLALDVKNLRDENLDKVQAVLMQQLKELADKGLDHQQLEAVMANQEFRMRERDYGYYPQGIIFGFSALESWLYGGNPAANLEVGDLFVRLREKMQQGYFEQLIRDLLLENSHSARVVLKPSSSAGEERRAKEQARLEKETSAWTEAEREAVAVRQEKLLAWQESQDTPETLATIPQLSLEDIPAQPEQIPTEVTEIAGIPVIKHELHAGGIAYVRLYFDANSCTEEELSCLQFASSLLGNMDTSDHSAAEIVNRTRLRCGEFKAKLMASASEEEPEHASTRLCIFFSALESKLAEAMAHVTEILTQSRFDEASVHDMLRQAKMEAFQKITMAAHAVSIHRISAQTSPVSVVTDRAEGVSYYQWLKAADDQWNFAQLKEQMGELLQRVIRRGGLTISIGGAADANASMLAERAAQLLPNAAAKANVCIKPWGKRKEGIVIPGDVAYAGLGGSVKACGGEYSGQMQLASQVISLGYLWNVIRVQNGAYGTGMVAQNRGEVLCYSYRDPNGAASLKAYRESADFLREFAAGTEDFTGFIIGAVAGASPLMTPNTKAKVADEWYFNQNTWEKRCLRRQQILNATAEDLQALADVIEKTLSDGGVCLIGGQTQLEKCDELDNIITL